LKQLECLEMRTNMTLKKQARKFFAHVAELTRSLNTVTSSKDGVWPFGNSCECKADECFLRDDGLWETKQLLNTGMHKYRRIFIWRILPNYGSTRYSAERQAEFLQCSETEKVLLTHDEYEFVWLWDTIHGPNEWVWGMDIGPRHYVLRKCGKEVLRADSKAAFLRSIDKLEEV
jgi:hypothetical protein